MIAGLVVLTLMTPMWMNRMQAAGKSTTSAITIWLLFLIFWTIGSYLVFGL